MCYDIQIQTFSPTKHPYPYSNKQGRTTGDHTTWTPMQDHQGNTHSLRGCTGREESQDSQAKVSESDRPFRFFYLILVSYTASPQVVS